MIRKKCGDVEWLEFELLSKIKTIKHAVFLRHGGVSEAPYFSLNAGAGTSDDNARIAQNLEKMGQALELDRLVTLYQQHGVRIVTVPSDDVLEGDILFTQERAVGLTIRHADCQATIVYDPKHHAVANVHCGWRGNVQNVYRHTIEWMQKTVGSDPKDLLVCISPSLGPDASEFVNYQTELPPSFLPFRLKQCHFNLWEISRHQLLESGIRSEHIEIAGLCTFSLAEDFFSYRREKTSGRHATIVALC